MIGIIILLIVIIYLLLGIIIYKIYGWRLRPEPTTFILLFPIILLIVLKNKIDDIL